MPNGKFILPEQETITMSGDAARRIIGCGSGDAALLYLYILQNGGVFSEEDAVQKIGRSFEQVNNALSILVRLGLVRSQAEPKRIPEPSDEMPQYTKRDIENVLQSDKVFPDLVHEIQRALGKVLSSDDLLKLFGIYDHLGLPSEVILTLVFHCVSEFEKKYGNGRKPTMRYIEQTAFRWEREGIFSLDAAEEYIKRYEKNKSASLEIASILQIRERRLSPSEQRYIDGWIAMNFESDVIAEAYDRTVLKTGKLAWSYMDSILRNWNSKGFHTLSDIKAGDRGPQKPISNAPAPNRNNEGPTASDLEHLRKTLERIKGGE